LLGRAPEERLNELAHDERYLSDLAGTMGALDAYLRRESWFGKTFGGARGTIGYFSMEFGIHECLPVYSGGLGVLAGDHLKTASDLGLPLVGIGIAFSQGYFRQSLDADGWQAERYPPNDWHDLPVSPIVDASGKRVVVSVALPAAIAEASSKPTQSVLLEAWRVDVGRVQLFLLDANVEQNRAADRALTNTL